MPNAADKPEGLNAGSEHRRDRRLYVWYGGTLALLLVLGLVSWLVVIPVMSVRREVRVCLQEWMTKWTFPSGPTRHVYQYVDRRTSVERLGGGHRTVHMVRVYLSMPRWMISDLEECMAVALLAECGEEAIPILDRLARREDFRARFTAVWALGQLGEGAVAVLVPLTTSPDSRMRWESAEALGNIGPRARDALPVLEALEKDQDRLVRQVASLAVWKVTHEDRDFELPLPVSAGGSSEEAPADGKTAR